MTHNCEICNKQFSSLNPNAVLCSDECRRVKHNRQQLDALARKAARDGRSYTRRILPTKNLCVICGRPFQRKSTNQLTCSEECARKQHLEKAKQRRAAVKAGEPVAKRQFSEKRNVKAASEHYIKCIRETDYHLAGIYYVRSLVLTDIRAGVVPRDCFELRAR